MANKPYKVIREAYEPRFMATVAAEYPGYRLYLMEANNNGALYSRSNQYMLSREVLQMGQTLMINDDTELTTLKGNGPAPLSLNGNRVVAYRPDSAMGEDLQIISAVTDKGPIESFPGGINISLANYYLYNALREGKNGYGNVLVRVFTDAVYGRGMAVPINETIALPSRSTTEPQHYLHDTSSKNYTNRISRLVRNAAGGTNSP